MGRDFCLTLSQCDLEGSLEDVIGRLQELSDIYGKDKRINLEIEEHNNTFGESDPHIAVYLEGE